MKSPSAFLSRRIILTVAVALLVVVADAVAKRAVQGGLDLGERREVVDDLLVLTHVHNTGAAYGLFAGHRWLLVLTAALIAAITPLLLRAMPISGRWAWAGPVLTGMIVGGAAGNLIERARHGYVTDFIQTPPIELFQVFNLADASISVAIVALLVLSFVARDEPATKSVPPASPSGALLEDGEAKDETAAPAGVVTDAARSDPDEPADGSSTVEHPAEDIMNPAEFEDTERLAGSNTAPSDSETELGPEAVPQSEVAAADADQEPEKSETLVGVKKDHSDDGATKQPREPGA